ncbi:UMP-CMP kinase [Dermatophagoides farinae]|uniref:UMP-CMP kinase n=2 Tax=Dermatophagoides farinae TaxID=6954 RepID=A0A922I316_DERFA|nr:UMP-CMP kinase-like [Dermatophagoides farinae]KAH9521086.1 cytidine monophosphate (UMP-CMP) kinase 1, cytosolic [Dermatophagoides farinae]
MSVIIIKRWLSYSRNCIVNLYLERSQQPNYCLVLLSKIHGFSLTYRFFNNCKMYDWNNLPRPNVIFVLGGPGAGKGTQCSLISKKFGHVHLSAGDLLRKEQNTAGSQYGELIAEHIKNGTIVPVEITCKLLMNAMLENMISLAKVVNGTDKPIAVGNFLIDGFPRNQDNLDGWQKFVGDKVKVELVLVFECPEEVYIARCLKRGQHSGRADDNPESMKKRLDTHLNQTMPIVKYYEKLNLVKRIDSSRSIKEVHEECCKILQSLMGKKN